ncbi:CRISPR-associated endonuclease Cas3'' [uncultured Veillonella sp.]|uniref:CRISPR-associated endonuclease Cas3'' n=1 Tax=uncultured Veillonella sp. TaxID=159268 RepID=UPI002604E426|nr:CRISPR-associated endonuclease Cas3'' [uncultured Veillonella sp.]
MRFNYSEGAFCVEILEIHKEFIMMDIHDLVAHIKQGSGERQGLIEHLLNCATYAKDMGKSIGIPHMCFLLGLLHDAGKYRPSFQEYICEGTNKKVIHSTTGARLIKKYHT